MTHNKKQRVLYDITPPTGAISSPSDGASIGGIVSIGVSYYDVLVSSYRSGADRGVLQIDIDGKGNWKDIAECPSNDGSSQYYTVTWDSTQPVETFKRQWVQFQASSL